MMLHLYNNIKIFSLAEGRHLFSNNNKKKDFFPFPHVIRISLFLAQKTETAEEHEMEI
jgi:hypothetical protein